MASPFWRNSPFREPRGRVIIGPVQTFAEQPAGLGPLTQMLVPDVWQQQAVAALRAGRDAVVQAPTGAGKTLIFELWSNQGKPRGQVIYTVPTRALANDKLAEWRARGWNVGIATGDLADNLRAPVLVATLETQKNRLIQGDGPSLLVVDEYQMLSDSDRGLNYELALALAPARTQLLLLSGSVGNPQDVVKWLRRLGREATLVRHDQRPVPLDEVQAANLSFHVPSEVQGYWPRLIAKALAEDLGPILVFAPRRQATEALALELMRQLPNPNPLQLSPEQKRLVGEHLARMLKCRVAYHHSGLSYGARAGVIEPLAKAGQLRVVVATMGLAAGINFSLRSVALAGDSYRRDEIEQPLKPDEILQMFGRAGRRGIDEMGYVLVSANQIRLLDAHACHLSRNGMVDWSALLGLMHGAAQQGREPFLEAVKVQERLFTAKPICLGVEESLKHPQAPCRLMADAERARHALKRVREMLNSRGQWQPFPKLVEKPLGDIFVIAPLTPHLPASTSLPPAATDSLNLNPGSTEGAVQEHGLLPPTPPALRPALTEPAALQKAGTGSLCVLREEGGLKFYGRTLTVAERLSQERVIISKWVRRLTNWSSRQAPWAVWQAKLVPIIEKQMAQRQTPVVKFANHPQKIVVHLSLAQLAMSVPVDAYGVALWNPPEREVLPSDCARCELLNSCRHLSAATGTAMLWRRLGLVDAAGVPTRRGRLVSFFSQGDGLAIAAALEDQSYHLDELVYDLANLEAGFRFCGQDNRWAGRLAMASHQAYGLQSVPGYLENGVPPKYGAGAEQIVASIHKNPAAKHELVSELLGAGDIDRIIIEWRSLLRQLAHAPEMDWPRWQELQRRARDILHETHSPTLTDLPPLEYHQTRRVDHRLILRRH
jgi:superfamily II DNA/RNA helicase